jgi:hypothetical protein
MRISADINDPGYDVFVNAKLNRKHVMVFVDGDPIREVVTADDVEGLCIVFLRDEQGQPIVNRVANSVVQRVIVGKVKIVLEDE